MNYGIQISASGALTSLHRQDALAGNLANLNTVGFKPITAGTRFRESVREEDGVWNLPSEALLEKLGAGVLSAPNGIDFAQGALEMTDSPLDVAIEGEGFFLIGFEGSTALSRDGRLSLDQDGMLVQSATGRPVLNTAGQPIYVDPTQGEIEIHGDGLITQRDLAIGQLALMDVPDRSVLKKYGEGLFVSQSGGPLATVDGSGMIRQRAVERSAVNEIDAMMRIQGAARSAQGNIGMIDMQNDMLSATIGTFGRLA